MGANIYLIITQYRKKYQFIKNKLKSNGMILMRRSEHTDAIYVECTDTSAAVINLEDFQERT